MEQHPVPQDIKSFQFKLIGDMTVRQFAFLAGGLIVAYLVFILPLNFFLKWTIIITSVFLGVGCAFVPINERPLDAWITAFFRAVFGPTQRIWRKEVLPPSFLTAQPRQARVKGPPPTTYLEDRKKLEEYLATLPKKTQEAVDEEEKKRLLKIASATRAEEVALPLAEGKTLPARPTVATTPALSQPAITIRNHEEGEARHLPTLSGLRVRKLGTLRREVPITKESPPELFEKAEEVTRVAMGEVLKQKRIEEYKEEIAKLTAEKERLLREAKKEREKARRAREVAAKIAAKKKEAAILERAKPAPLPAVAEPTQQAGPIKKLVLPKITDVANVINGVVADSEGNVLPEAIVVVKDRDGTPVRALKTNSLGQFAISTPLPNGAYSIETEKEGFKFDIIYQEVKGAVLPPLEIRAK